MQVSRLISIFAFVPSQSWILHPQKVFLPDFGFEILCKKKLWFWKRIISSCCLLGRKCWCLTRLAQTINWERNFLRRWGKSGQNENEFKIDHIHWLEVLNLLQHASRRFVFLRNLQPNLGHQFRKNLFTLKIGRRKMI